MHKRRVLVTGSNGVVGSYVSQVFDNQIFHTYLTSRIDLDITDNKQVLAVFHSFKPDLVLHLAAKTNVDQCEQNPIEAYKVNTEGTRNIVSACSLYKTTLAYVSTAAVFDGNKKGFFEDDAANPLNIYGKSKIEAEKTIRGSLRKHYIVRAGWIIGGGKKEKKFISYVFESINNGKQVRAVDDIYGTVTYAKDLVKFIKDLYLKHYEFGIYHFGSQGICSRYDIAKQIARVVKSKAEIVPVSWKYFTETFFAPRPKNEILKSCKISFPNSWKETISYYIKHEII